MGEPNTWRLPDGRRLGYAEYGDPRGRAVFYCHGFPGSRIEARLADDAARQVGARLIAVDRPGFGLSDFQPSRAIVDWSADLSALADGLGIGRFTLLGVSGGAPYALAGAAQLRRRVISVAVVGALAPPDRAAFAAMPSLQRIGLGLARRLPYGARLFFGLVSWAIRRQPARVLAYIVSAVNAKDRTVLSRTREREALLVSFCESVREGGRGCAHELALFVRPWGFAFQTIEADVQLWHGEQDAIVPVAMGRTLAQALPRCRTHFLPEEGHYSLPLDHSAAILAALLESAATT